ncbi:MAG: CopG family transcriptional regulator [Candidatus Lokiarchaeota archaeon]|nr:CopG family transcriptional regulator [Candidatus Lokiarchaeota archaeon]
MLEKERINNRITIALDNDTSDIIGEMKLNISISQSELIRRAIKFYYKFNKISPYWENGMEKRLNTYIELLSNGEHIILDIDHYLSFLKFIENSPEQDNFWKLNRTIGKAHAEEFLINFKTKNVHNIIEHLEICNFFKIVCESSNSYTLLLGSDLQKNFIKIFLEEILKGMGFNVIIKEGFSKLVVLILENGTKNVD